jgi:hypothetical protein
VCAALPLPIEPLRQEVIVQAPVALAGAGTLPSCPVRLGTGQSFRHSSHSGVHAHRALTMRDCRANQAAFSLQIRIVPLFTAWSLCSTHTSISYPRTSTSPLRLGRTCAPRTVRCAPRQAFSAPVPLQGQVSSWAARPGTCERSAIVCRVRVRAMTSRASSDAKSLYKLVRGATGRGLRRPRASDSCVHAPFTYVYSRFVKG